jgi:fumarate reductase subunit D
VAAVKRSHAPVFWLLFGAGGLLCALLGPALVVVTGIAGPRGWLPGDPFAYARVLRFAQHGGARAFVFAVIALFAWHAMHRLLHSLHDVGIPIGTPSKCACYGGALLITVVAGGGLLAIGS